MQVEQRTQGALMNQMTKEEMPNSILIRLKSVVMKFHCKQRKQGRSKHLVAI